MKEKRKRKKEIPRMRKTHHKGYCKIKGSSSRKCRTCKKDPWPNYFYCPECLEYISKSVDMRDMNSNGVHHVGV